ncbi:hypothetical protein PAXRUDRAFT_836551 [Paxillus rubicundulus Ve08.2h10]|uniref:Uncharacterized protein n=1 Tax=Paxillus rubicundulus Ve08.2h10 TaxID=930991 RepID=A0A0D0D581_9AGAM|nr:hypothetical protein PAXRUDRAFT_836551 [Paxillus rubicundulus Ve08.2h10]
MKSARRHPGFIVLLLCCRLHRSHSSITSRVQNPLFAIYESIRYIRKSTIIISSVASSIHMYDVESGKLVLGPIQGHTEPVTCVLSRAADSSRCHTMNQGESDFLDLPTSDRRFIPPRRFCHCLEALVLNVFGAIWQLAVSRPPVSDQLSPNLSERLETPHSHRGH